MPAFRRSSPELVARFDDLAALAEGASRKQMFGYPSCVLRGNMFMGLFEDSLILRLSETDRAAFRERVHAALFEPMAGRPMKEYVVVPPSLINDGAIEDWVRRSVAYAEQLPPKPPRKKTTKVTDEDRGGAPSRPSRAPSRRKPTPLGTGETTRIQSRDRKRHR